MCCGWYEAARGSTLITTRTGSVATLPPSNTGTRISVFGSARLSPFRNSVLGLLDAFLPGPSESVSLIAAPARLL